MVSSTSDSVFHCRKPHCSALFRAPQLIIQLRIDTKQLNMHNSLTSQGTGGESLARVTSSRTRGGIFLGPFLAVPRGHARYAPPPPFSFAVVSFRALSIESYDPKKMVSYACWCMPVDKSELLYGISVCMMVAVSDMRRNSLFPEPVR